MSESRWDVPHTDEGMQVLLERLNESYAAGDELEFAHGLVKLSWLGRWVSIPDVASSFGTALDGAQRALEIYRRLDYRPGIVRAIVSGHVFRPDADAMLDEAEAIAREFGDEKLIGEVLSAKCRRPWATVEYIRQTLEIFERNEDVGGQAGCHFTLSIKPVGAGVDRVKRMHALKAAALYAEIGNGTRWKCLTLAAMNNETPEDWEEMEPLFWEELRFAFESGGRSLELDAYRGLARCFEVRAPDEASKYRRWAEELRGTTFPSVVSVRREELGRLSWQIAQARRRGDAEAAARLTREREAVRVRKLKWESTSAKYTPLLRRGGGRKLRRGVASKFRR